MSDIRNVGTGSGGGIATLWLYLDQQSLSTTASQQQLPALQNTNSFQNTQTVTLAVGDNVITVPTMAGAVVFEFPLGNTNAVSLNVGGQTLALSPNGINVLSFANPPPASLTFTVSTAIVNAILRWL